MAEEKKTTAEKPQVVAKGRVHKETMSQKIAHTFISDEADTVGDYILYDVIIPGVGDALMDILHGSIDRIFGRGNSRSRGSYGRSRRGYKTSYDAYYDDDDYYGRRRRRSRSRYDDDDDRYERRRRSRSRSDDFRFVDFDSRPERDLALDKIADHIREYDDITVAKVKYMCGLGEDVVHTDNNWGWSDMRDIHKTRNGEYYAIEFEPPEPLD